MMPRKNLFIFVIGSFLFVLVNQCLATPQLNQQDPYVIYTARCSDKFYVKRDKKLQFNIGLTPLYQQTHYARGGGEGKVRLGEMSGKWNMLAPFFNINDMVDLNSPQYSNMNSAYKELKKITPDPTDSANYNPAVTGPLVSLNPPNVGMAGGAAWSDYEKLGLRGKIGIDLGCGVGMNVKGGVGDYKMSYKATNTTNPNQFDFLVSATASAAPGIFRDLNLDTNPFRETAMEDTHVEVYWQYPFYFKDEGEVVVVFAPYISIGGWLPTGNEKEVDKACSLPTGNNGHYGVTIEGALNFDFPGTVQLSVGGGAVICDKHKYSTFRLPSNIYQTGFYPWTTTVKEKPGTTWYFNASFKAENFIKDLGFYFDYVYTYHEKDDITLLEPIVARSTLFAQALPNYIERTTWRNQQVNAGFTYQITKILAFGVAIQAHITGTRVFRTTTEMGYIELKF